MSMLRLAYVMIATLSLTNTALAWIDTGHMLVGEIAKRELTPTARQKIEFLLSFGSTEKTKDMVTATCWADDFKTAENGPWHYINIHFRTDGKPITTKPLDENVVWAIERFSKELVDPFLDNTRKADALRYLLHFVGDIHQPMHTVACDTEAHPEGDRGGNDFTFDEFELAGFKVRNLHFLWDIGGGLYGKTDRPLAAGNAVTTLADKLIAQNPRSSYAFITEQKPQIWVEESLALARSVAYDLPMKVKPSESYLLAAQHVSSRRITLAGYRMADMLNRLLTQ